MEVDKKLSMKPEVKLSELARHFNCSHPTIEKAILKHSSLSFRSYQAKKLLEKGSALLKQGYSTKQIAYELGYKWPESFSRFVKKAIGCSLREFNNNKTEFLYDNFKKCQHK
jgi:AraC-like DNA-binding protein